MIKKAYLVNLLSIIGLMLFSIGSILFYTLSPMTPIRLVILGLMIGGGLLLLLATLFYYRISSHKISLETGYRFTSESQEHAENLSEQRIKEETTRIHGKRYNY